LSHAALIKNQIVYYTRVSFIFPSA